MKARVLDNSVDRSLGMERKLVVGVFVVAKTDYNGRSRPSSKFILLLCKIRIRGILPQHRPNFRLRVVVLLKLEMPRMSKGGIK